MPIITLTISHQDIECKRCLAESLTKAASEATKIPEQAFVVVIDEHPRESIAVGGKLLADR